MSIEISVKITGEVELERTLKRIPDQLEAMIPYALEETGNRAVEAMKSLVRVKTGLLRDSIYTMRDPGGQRIGVAAPHGVFIEAGTRPHVITPRRPGGLLRWESPPGTVHWAKRVQHPGTRPYPFFKPVVMIIPRMMREIFNVEASRVMRVEP